MSDTQCTADILMIRPINFCANLQTAASNRFQQITSQIADAPTKAAAEFDELAVRLRAAGVRVHVFEDTPEPATPDALFPNNWLSFHSDGTVVLYPMLAPNRRLERRPDILEVLSQQLKFRLREVVDLTRHENDGRYLEGTGSLVLDRINHIAYATISPRTDLDVLGDFSQRLDYELVTFRSEDRNGVPIYHTNVLMSIGRQFAVVCTEAIHSEQRTGVTEALLRSGRAIIEISAAQMTAFAGNILELASYSGGHVIALSEQAANSLTTTQRAQLTKYGGPLVSSPIPTIEALGGGSVRCMLAEIHLPSVGSG